MLSVDIIITCYNRKALVTRAVDSALEILATRCSQGKIIIVDDASTDTSVQTLKEKYAAQIEHGEIALVLLPKNQGVTGAKNAGLNASSAQWAVILDSDDTMISAAWPRACQTLEQSMNAPLVLFRCVDENGNFVGTSFDEPQELTLPRFLQHTSYGEVIVAVNHLLIGDELYDTDLRGFEGIGCARVIKRFGPAILSPIILRAYDQSGTDRLSSLSIFRSRARFLARGHVRMLRLFFFDMPMTVRIKTMLKILFYSALALIRRR